MTPLIPRPSSLGGSPDSRTMAKTHWHPDSATVPKTHCGVAVETARLTRDRDRVTCKRCRRFMVMAEIGITPVLGRPVEVRCDDGTRLRGQLFKAGRFGIELLRHQDGQQVVVRWGQLEGFEYLELPTKSRTSE